MRGMADGEALAREALAGDLRAGTSPLEFRPLVRARHRDRDFVLRRALLLADMAGLWLALAFSLTAAGQRGGPLLDSLWMLPTLLVWAVLFQAYGLYQRPIRRFEPTHLDDLAALFHALVVGALGLWAFYRVAPVAHLSLDEVLIFGLMALLLIFTLRIAVRSASSRLRSPEKVFAIAPLEDVRMLQRKIANHPEYEMTLHGAVDAEEIGLPLRAGIEELDSIIASHEVDHLFVQLDSTYIPQERVAELMRACHRAGIRFSIFPSERCLLLSSAEVNHLEGMGILSYHPPVLSRASQLVKRGFDLVISILLLVLFAPVMALVALAIKLDARGRGPVLFRQVRVGQDGRPFNLVKFRTMVPGADRLVGELMERSIDPDWLIIENDPRVTRVGRFLRLNSLDELPQLWNVLKGEMSLVGPRPLSERDDRAVQGWERHRLDLVPGLTGPWQVLGRNSIPFREMVEIDYAYVVNWSLWHDLKLLARTVPVVLRRRGAN
jgi:exopolysaccharide biosynthesis polyprenyl glycosylphosphotransferase